MTKSIFTEIGNQRLIFSIRDCISIRLFTTSYPGSVIANLLQFGYKPMLRFAK